MKIIYAQSNELVEDLLREERVRRPLDSLKEHHKETYEHSIRVGLLSVDLGQDRNCDDDELRSLGYSGLLHDIGKIKIPLAILTKKRPLTDIERKIVNGHSRLGLLEIEENFDEMVKQIVVSHHEYKTNPYPRDGEDRRKIPRGAQERREISKRESMLSQIVAVADMYDALASLRSYKSPLSLEEIKHTLNSQFTGKPIFIRRVLKRHE